MFIFFFFGCTPSIDCSVSETNTFSGQSFGMDLDSSSEEQADSEAYHFEAKQPGSLYNGLSLSLHITNRQTVDTGRLVIYQQEARPSIELVPSFETFESISEEISGLGTIIYDELIEPDELAGSTYEILHVLGNQYEPVTYLTFISSQLSTLSLNVTEAQLSYCQRSSQFLQGETGGNLEITELWSSPGTTIEPSSEPELPPPDPEVEDIPIPGDTAE